jgi:hypothetical protein
MDDDLGLSIGDRYSILTMIFFIPYIIFQFPANIVIRKLGPSVWLPSLVVLWGAVTVGLGFTTHWTQALGCRIILGVLEVASSLPMIAYPQLNYSTGWLLSGMCLPSFVLVHAL